MTIHTHRRGLIAGAAALTGLAAAPAWAQASAEDAHAAAAVLLFDPTTTDDQRAAFWRERLSSGGQRRWPLEAFQADTAAVAALTGGVDLIAVRTIAEPQGRSLRAQLRARKGGRTRWIRIRPDREDPSRLYDLSTFPTPAPYDREGPTGPTSRDALALEIERRVRYAVANDDFSGAVLIAAPDGATLWQGAFGTADRVTGRPCTVETPFHLGSADKSFTAILAARLIGEGRMGFETRLVEVLPDYPDRAFAEACTVGHLLAHESGLGGLFDRPGWDGARPFSRMAELFPAFAAEPPAFAPGTAAAYSNEGYVVLGAVVEAVSGASWYDLLDTQIYRPVGMGRSAHYRRDEANALKAIGYMYPEADRLGLGEREPNAAIQGYRGNSCGGGYSTIGDMTRYLRALRAGRLIPRDRIQSFITPRQGGLPGYGSGFAVKAVAGRTLVGHGGGGPRSGVDGDHAIVWETGWSLSILGNYDAPFVVDLSRDIGRWLALQDA